MLDIINSIFINAYWCMLLYLELWQAYLIIIGLTCACVLTVGALQYKFIKYKRQSSIIKNSFSLINLICLFTSVIVFTLIVSLLPWCTVLREHILYKSYILCLYMLCLFNAVRLLVVVPINLLVCLVVKLVPKTGVKAYKDKQYNKLSSTDIDDICADFTRSWIAQKVQIFPQKSRYELIVSNKNEYVEELIKLLPNSCNKTKVALHQHSQYCSLWK